MGWPRTVHTLYSPAFLHFSNSGHTSTYKFHCSMAIDMSCLSHLLVIWLRSAPRLQYFTRQCATPGCMPLVLAGVNRGYPVYSMLYNTSRISGPKEEWIGLMWPVECTQKPVQSQFLRPFATQCSKQSGSCRFAVLTMCMYVIYICDNYYVVVRSVFTRQQSNLYQV